jgi:pyridoxal 5'-phosphate synthase pdxT subunit
MILLARNVEGEEPHETVGLMDISVCRNGYGSQNNSFIDQLDLLDPLLTRSPPYNGVFIRAPRLVRIGDNVDVVATYRDEVVAVRQGRLLATSFHPELADDSRFHEYFLKIVVD